MADNQTAINDVNSQGVHLNALPDRLTHSDGEVIWQGEFDEWGKEWSRSSFIPLNYERNLRFAGQYLYTDNAVRNSVEQRFALAHRASLRKRRVIRLTLLRYYALECGRFTQQDPIGLLGGLNLYQYAPNTISWIDPLGLIGQEWDKILAKDGRPKPAVGTMERPHGHHIVFKGRHRGTSQKSRDLYTSKNILKQYRVNINSPDNLMWAPNVKGVHTPEKVKQVKELLQEAHKDIQTRINNGEISKKQGQKEMKCRLRSIGRQVFG